MRIKHLGNGGGFRKVRRALVRGLEGLLAMLMIMSVTGGLTAGATESDKGSPDDKKQYKSTNFKEGSYGLYKLEHADKKLYDGEPIIIKGTDYKDTNMNIRELGTYEGTDNVVYLSDVSAEQEEAYSEIAGDELELEIGEMTPAYVTYEFSVPETALYEIYFKYYPTEGRGSDIERGVMIDGELPFNECEYITFSRVWGDAVRVGSVTDAAGNEIHPKIIEKPEWRIEYLDNNQGYYSEAFRFYLKKGTHEIKIISRKEPMLLAEICFCVQDPIPTYEEVKQLYEKNGYKPATGQPVIVEGEDTFTKSSSSIYPYYSRASALTTSVNGKFAYNHTQTNVIGGNFWKKAGDWLTWKITVPESGLYKIALRARQNINRGFNSGRILTIDGKIPFEEAKKCKFNYSADFSIYTLGEAETGEEFLFYFETGRTYVIGMEVTLGVVHELAQSIDNSVNIMMTVYRRFLMLIGNEPDKERDFDFHKYMPEELRILNEQADVLRDLAKELNAIAGERTSQQATLERAAERMEKMSERQHVIAKNFNEFKNEISIIADWILELNHQPLEIDKIYILPPDAKDPKANTGFFASMGHEIKLFWASFTTDYTVLGESSREEDAITVWFTPNEEVAKLISSGGREYTQVKITGGGREHAQVLKQMIDDEFVTAYDIPVTLQLIEIGALLPATLAGKGPDVALQVVGDRPVQFAMRGAVHNLAEHEDFEEVAERFYSSAMVQFTYQDGVYALPETQTFQVMFYRKDIMEELGLELPQTWEDVYDMIPELQNNYMNFGYPAAYNNFVTLIYQRGGTIYKGEGKDLGYASNLDSPEAIDAFISYIDLYRSYKVDLFIDFQTRFRVGVAPIGIADFTMVNLLSVVALEIEGLWDIALVPGTERVDENGNKYIDRSVAADVTGSIILEKSTKKDKAWKFIKWWTSDDVQARYCAEVEATMGQIARIPSANKSVMYKQPWTNSQYQLLSVQRSWAKGIPEVPGGYYTLRHADNAFNRTYTLMTDPRETLLDYLDEINAELTKKRQEMGISTIDDILKRTNTAD